jgi:hypothetical protein
METLSMRIRHSLDFIDGPARVAGDKALAIHQQVQLFQNDGPDQGILPIRLDDRIKGSVTSQKLDVGSLGFTALSTAAIGVADVDLTPQRLERLVCVRHATSSRVWHVGTTPPPSAT